MKVHKSLMYPERVSNDGQQPDEFTAPPARAPGTHFIPGFVRRRPIRAVLLAAAVFAIPYSLARHQGEVTAQRSPAATAPAPAASAGRSDALPMSPVAIDTASGKGTSPTSWNPPIGMDRTNEALDQLTFDFGSGSQTPDHPSGFQADSRVASLPADAAQPAPAQVPVAAPAEAPVEGPADAPLSVPVKPRVSRARPLDEIDQYLWNVYQRAAKKQDSSGDFTWKDEAAAARLGLVTRQYVIGGMDPDFRELLYNLGHGMDAAGINWTILSGFRDDYRQGLASGYKARVGNSFHGGSRATGGYGHGCAADIEATDGESDNAVWKWVDQHGEKFGIVRPMKQIDPAHIQPSGGWHDIALNLRDKRITAENSYLPASAGNADGEKVTRLVDTRSGVSETQFDCVRSHHHSDFRLAGLSHRHGFPGRVHPAVLFQHGRMHRFGRRRMVVDVGGPDQRRDAETVLVADRDGAAKSLVKGLAKSAANPSADTPVRTADARSMDKHAKAEASGGNRRDAGQNKVAEAGRPEKRPGKDASVNADRAQRDAGGPDTKASKVGATVADGRRADDKHPQKRAAAANAERQTKTSNKTAKAKGHVADCQDASDKNDKKL